ncbi:aminodeoxychorismate/anthranilate synthase component II [Sphingomonas daechungensis]|uniref:anthranilate synthase n=1 Tax=Sphingomonas daechungensis TaxID=1176646 RepID=A0ABX6T3H5_9SPHN|nr:aminodeoxychorismate/anthranilate synthase component II [Sphingomonas daechungensis]QNP43452.1 aminodeoxychorismate/anthranilate synthase component II [Sphingomonas daechungensis]
MSRNVLMVDNHDSFTFNIVEALERLGATVRAVRNEIAAADALDQARETSAVILISPGPGRPEDAGCCIELISLAKGEVPLFGVCLGQQAIVLEAGGEVVRAPDAMHGKASALNHDGSGPFEGLPETIKIGRYHSLCTPNPPSRFRVHASIDGMAMAISDVQAKQVGVQFHPESVLTPVGQRIFANVLKGFD